MSDTNMSDTEKELQAMQRIAETMAGLPFTACSRVLSWMRDRFVANHPDAPKPPRWREERASDVQTLQGALKEVP